MTAAPVVEVRAVHEVGAELDALVPEWDALARRHGLDFACRPSYALAWWVELGSGRLEVVTARRDGRLVAVAPLHRRHVLGQPVLRWLGHGLGAVGELVAEDEAAASAVWAWLADRGTPLQLTPLRLDDTGTLALRRAERLEVRLDVDERCLVLQLAPGSRASDVRGTRSLKRLASYRGALARQDLPLAVELITDLEGLRRAWPEIVRVAADAARDRPGPNLCAPPYAELTRRFLEQEARAGALVVAGVTVGGRWAGHLVLPRSGRSLSLWLLRTDPVLGRYGLAHLLMEQLVDRHDEVGVERIDLGVGESSFRSPWSNTAYDVATAVAAPRHAGVVQARLGVANLAVEAARRLRARAGGRGLPVG